MATPPHLALRIVDGCHAPTALVANFQLLKFISHPNLAQYVDVLRGRALRLGVVCEHYALNLAELLLHRHPAGLPQPWVWGCGAQLLSAVAAIHEQGLVHHRLSSASVLVCHAASDGPSAVPDSADAPTLKLADWCLHHTTAGGTLAPRLAGDPRYLSPEQVVSGPANQSAPSGMAAGAADVWAIGILLVEMIAGALPDPLRGSDPSELLRGILGIAWARCDAPPGAARWPATHSQRFSSVEAPLLELLDSCLEPRSTDRPDAKSLIKSHRQLAAHASASTIRGHATEESAAHAVATAGAADQAYLRPQLEPIATVCRPPAVPAPGEAMEVNLTSASEEAARAGAAAVRQLRELFYSWLAGTGEGGNNADAADALMTAALNNRARWHSSGGGAGWGSGRPLRDFPTMTFRDRLYSVAVGEDGASTEGVGSGVSDVVANGSFIALPASLFGEQLPVREDTAAGAEATAGYVPPASDVGAGALTEPRATCLRVTPACHPLWDGCSAQERQQLRVSAIADAALSVPVPLRERHRGYQEARVAQFRALLHKAASPDSRRDIIREARTDIPPTLRALVWPHLLGISATSLDENTPPSLDEARLDEKTRKQIDVDLPRCHQENAILASAEGQTCLGLVLEAWLLTHSQSSVYCQGLDSLAAPFVILFYHRVQGRGKVQAESKDAAVQGLACLQPDSRTAAVDHSQQEQDSGLSRRSTHSHLRPAVQPAYCCLVAFTGRFLNRIFASDDTSMLRAQLAEVRFLFFL